MLVEFSKPEDSITRATIAVTASQAEAAFKKVKEEYDRWSFFGMQCVGHFEPELYVCTDFGHDGYAYVDLEKCEISVDRFDKNVPSLDENPTIEDEWISYAPLLRKLLVAA